MTMNAKRRRAHDKLATMAGVRPVRRPVTPDGCEEFDLYYVRTGRKSPNPLVVIPGGPVRRRWRCIAGCAGMRRPEVWT